MKSCGIVSQLTPPYTPQYNEVFERKTQTLLDMVRSMMNLTALPKSFWGYALESAARILNMVQTKKLPPNGRTVGSKWLFKKKTDMDGNVHTFKAPFGLANDVKIAFLNGHLSEDVYMVQPEGFVDPKHPNKVCKHQRSIYGLKQASRSWNKRFDVEIKKIGFTQNPDESYVYLKASRSSVAFLILYVDDILRMKNNVTMLQEVKSWLSKYFSMKDLGEATYILGIKIIRNRSKRLIALSQRAYLEKILKKFRMENSKKGYTPMMEKPDYKKSQCAKTPSEQNPGEIHWTAVKTILKYLRNTKDMVLVYGAKPEAELKVSSVDWKSAKQSTTSLLLCLLHKLSTLLLLKRQWELSG
ncbi:retrotransposon protein, putative, ty1-copia subclass [Tanacetum coccineum]